MRFTRIAVRRAEVVNCKMGAWYDVGREYRQIRSAETFLVELFGSNYGV